MSKRSILPSVNLPLPNGAILTLTVNYDSLTVAYVGLKPISLRVEIYGNHPQIANHVQDKRMLDLSLLSHSEQ